MPTSVFSESSESHFTGVRLAACAALLALVQQLEDGDEAFVRARYENEWQQYERVLSLLMAAGIVRRENGKLRAKRIEGTRGLAEDVLGGLSRMVSAAADELRAFVAHFRRNENGLAYHPHELQRSSHSALRNFLLEAEALEATAPGGPYRLARHYQETIYRLMRPRRSTSSERLAVAVEDRGTVGSAAEIAVLNHERSRLGPQHENSILHVSLGDSEAGYDIRSVRSKTEGSPIFLEVKAVSEVDWCFFWTRNEVSAAQWLGEAYCLILVPVTSGGECAVEKARRLWNPAAAGARVDMSPTVWQCKPLQLKERPETKNA